MNDRPHDLIQWYLSREKISHQEAGAFERLVRDLEQAHGAVVREPGQPPARGFRSDAAAGAVDAGRRVVAALETASAYEQTVVLSVASGKTLREIMPGRPRVAARHFRSALGHIASHYAMKEPTE